eukprot:TRINITY_DN3571_c0_g1_i2.p1 TRINITY_DN3571_c0_g1~~TRINITY_DN3571_c0_g1_i2.p1  ORF type:complete len:339 (-),score=74.16 TRINITY_DN3571_c0_g1_i2:303-1202(-)
MAEPFAHAVSRQVVAALCKEIGFSSAEERALELLTDVMEKYIEEIGHASHRYAEIATRTESNFVDVRAALGELDESISALMRFNERMPSVKLPTKIPSFPLPSFPHTLDDRDVRTEPVQPLPEHIPSFFPPFPDSHTYKKTETIKGQQRSETAVRRKRSKRKRQVEEAVIRLQQREIEIEDEMKGRAAIECREEDSSDGEDVLEHRAKRARMQESGDMNLPSGPIEANAEATPVMPNPRHITYMDTEQERDGGQDRVSRPGEMEDDVEQQRKLQKVDMILSQSADTQTILRNARSKKPD